MKIISFNVNGIRAIAKKDFYADMKKLNPEVICLQETKAMVSQVKETVEAGLSGYHIFANEADRKGYSGTAILTKSEPIKVTYDMGIEEHDKEGRVICAEYKDYYLITVYTPNSGSELLRLDYRQKWDNDFLAYIKNLEKSKPVLVCGDLNVAHKAIDLARPKPNYNKSAGFMQEEIDGLDAYVKNGFIDTFRHFNPEVSEKYSWWSYRGGARDKNVGWRIDYFLCSENMISNIKKVDILNDVKGSDHCPVMVEL
ncbi:MAG: exodeoxyribonuclease-3 [Lentimonas sp.]|jgi:exodeoxyribonuclease-3